MIICNSIQEIREELLSIRNKKMTLGFVPTMGALHKGHLSLVEQSEQENDITVVSIFVNPTQFNDKKDLKNYPRDFEADCKLLYKVHCDFVFHPDVEDMYPEPDKRTFEFGLLESVMEGKHRQGHFNGVAQIVSKLFDIVEPDKAYFGQKDFQQLAIIKRLVRDYSYPVKIIGCPIIREGSGLAMSSRNELLTIEQRNEAALIFKTLCLAKEKAATMKIDDLKKWVTETINKNPLLKTEYFEIVDDTDLQPVNDFLPGKQLVACIAVYAGNIRLIDNIIL